MGGEIKRERDRKKCLDTEALDVQCAIRACARKEDGRGGRFYGRPKGAKRKLRTKEEEEETTEEERMGGVVGWWRGGKGGIGGATVLPFMSKQ